MPEADYTVDLPGFNDIIRIPALDDPEIIDVRIQRMKTHRSPVPEPLQWIPSVIEMLDDAQDLLFTGLVLAKPLLKRLPARFIPGLGWILLANDVLNLGTALLGTALGGKGPKKAALDAIAGLTGGKTRRYVRAANFLAKTPWLSFVLQAPQALESLTGYGLSLGSIMGALNDTVWAGIRSLQGKTTEFRAPPPESPFEKAVRYMTAPWTLLTGDQILSPEDHTLTLAAASIAAQIIADQPPSNRIADRVETLAVTEVPTYRPWNTTSIAMLAKHGMRPDAPIRPFVATPGPRPTFLQATQLTAASTDRFQRKMREAYGRTSRGTIASMLMHQTGAEILDILAAGERSTETVFNEFDIFLMSAIEFNVFPTDQLSAEELLAWYRTTQEIVAARGLNAPTRRELQEGAVEALGGWTQRPVGFS